MLHPSSQRRLAARRKINVYHNSRADHVKEPVNRPIIVTAALQLAVAKAASRFFGASPGARAAARRPGRRPERRKNE
jgi:hypothetical protein